MMEVTRDPITRQYWISEKNCNFNTWKLPARRLGIKTLYEYVKFLKDNYDVEIAVNWGPPSKRRAQNLIIKFNLKEHAEDLLRRCSK
jgi:hypothetical protein